MSDVLILSSSLSLVKYAGPYVAAKSSRDAGYSVRILDYALSHPDIIDYVRSNVSPRTKLLVISSTFFNFKNTRVKRTKMYEKKNLALSFFNLHTEDEEDLIDFFDQLRDVLPKDCKISIAGDLSNTIYRYYSLINDNHPIKSKVDFYFLGRDDNILLSYLENRTQNYRILHDKFYIGNKSAMFANMPMPTMIYTSYDGIRHTNESLTIEVSRGCAFNCRYCTYDKRTVNKMSMDLLYDQFLKYYDMFGTTNYNFTTDCFNDNIDFVRSFYEMTQKLPFKIQWASYARPDLCNRYPEVVDLMLESGAVYNYYGVETVTREVAKRVGRGLDFTKILEVFEQFKKKDPKYFIRTNFIIGLPGETEETLLDLIDWVKDQKTVDAAWADVLTVDPSLEDSHLLFSESDMTADPKKYGFKELRWTPEIYWEHETMNRNTATEILKQFNEARNSNSYISRTSLMGPNDLLTLGIKQNDFKSYLADINYLNMIPYNKKKFIYNYHSIIERRNTIRQPVETEAKVLW